ncbi:serine hydrolase domain-containing protein [Caulobacter segnis]
MALFSDSSAADAAGQADGLPRARASAVGIDGAKVAGFVREALEAGLDLHAVMLHRDGHVAVDAAWWPYRTDTPRVMHSVAKSVTACAIGLALAEKRFALTDKVVSFFPEHLPSVVDDKLAAMTVEDLLTMRTGHAAETSGALWRGSDESWIAKFFGIPITHPPGGAYVYTSAASYMLAAILSRTTGQTLHDYLKPRLFEPLGITGETWDIGSDGINPGGNGLTFKPVDLLKLGALHAQNGVWNGQRLLPADWVARATRAHSEGGYGYHWVVRPDGSYSALGLFVQMATVFPEAGATLVVVGAIDGSEKIAPFIDRWMPQAFDGGSPQGDAALDAALADLHHTRPLNSVRANTPRLVDGVTYRLEDNLVGARTVRVDFQPDACVFTLVDASGEHAITAGRQTWIAGVTDMPGRDLHHGYALQGARVLAGAEQVNETTTRLTWIFPDTAFRDTVWCRFEGERLTLTRTVNVNSSALAWPELTGTAERSLEQK